MHENCEHVYALTDSVETYTITPSYVYLHKMHTAFPTQTSKLQNCVGQGHARDRDDAVNDIEEDGVHAHVSIEEDGAHAQVSEQATSDYHRLLREPTDLAAIVCFFHPVSGTEKAG